MKQHHFWWDENNIEHIANHGVEPYEEDKMTQLPKFENDEEAAIWFDTHDTAAFMDDMEEIDFSFNIERTLFPTKPMGVRLRTDYLEAIQQVAERNGVPYQMLIQRWLLEKLNQEAPDLIAP